MIKKLKVLTALLVSSVMAVSMFGCSSAKTSEGKVTVRLNEVTRSVFYAPMYIAMSEGFFSENGIEIDLQTGQADLSHLLIYEIMAVRIIFFNYPCCQ